LRGSGDTIETPDKSIKLFGGVDITASQVASREWLKKGQAFEMTGDFVAAVTAYDRAVIILAELHRCGNSSVRYELAVAWMNRGNALQKQDGEHRWEDALRSYGRTIALLKCEPLRDQSERLTLGCAQMNRAGVMQKHSQLSYAAASCDDAITTLRELLPNGDFQVNRTLAAAWLVRGSIALGVRTIAAIEMTISCARESLRLLEREEPSDLIATDITLKSHQLFCEACGLRLDDKSQRTDIAAIVGEVSDHAEAALKIILNSAGGKFGGSGWNGTWFFRFAASLYAEYQPQFLGEFVMEHLRSGGLRTNPVLAEEWRGLAVSALSRARVRLHSLLFSDPGATEAARWLEALGALATLEMELMNCRQNPDLA
jgi:tetratricopeptide (TPR) repeat protein